MIVTTTVTASRAGRSVGELLREWRDRRRISQLDLAISAEISTRHLSFVETGRSKPSRDMVLRLGEHLEVPLRERNQLLLAAGYAPAYAESGLGAPEMAAVSKAVRQLLTSHEPYPAAVADRWWNLVDANASVSIMTDLVSPTLMTPPVNVLRLTLHPEGMAPHVLNLGEWRAHLLGRLRRQVTQTADPVLTDLLEELLTYPCADPVPEVEVPGPGDIFVPLRLRHEGADLTFFSTVSTFGTPLDITVAELVIESFFPADADTAEHLRAYAARGME
ncbi:helix-turn-helix domain-containing protein [Amycolatopsis thailandensis]|uniref:helix-turn-helix domain-containing protein n=1 Tax=Amycolatopsis thailandensis TaxID=589330 RepID=UPI00142DF70F|nr:helix-turn-helix transcriptional regulator [Amycolatopsis thailandensis]